MKNRILWLWSTVIVVLFVSILTGCDRGEDVKKISFSNIERQELEPAAPENRPLRIAIAAMISPKETYHLYKEMLDFVGKQLAMPIELVQKETYAQVNELLKNEQLDVAFVCSGAYVDGHEDFGMEILVAPVVYGKSVYYSYIIVHKESEIEEFEGLRGKSFAFTDPMSNTGRLVPLSMLARMHETPDSFFSRYIFTYSHDKSIESVARKLVDGAAVDSLVWDYLAAGDPKFTSKTKIIKKSVPFGIPPVVVSQGVSSVLKEKIKNVFLHLHEDKQGRAILKNVHIDRFIVTEDGLYDSIREMSASVGAHEKE